MPRRRLLSILLIPTVVVLFGAATMVAGNAANPEYTTWPGPPICATGTLSLVAIDVNSVTLAGSIQPCAGTPDTTVQRARWAIARRLTTRTHAHTSDMRPFASATAPTTFEARVWLALPQEEEFGPVQSACLHTAWERVACVAISTDSNGVLRVEPIPVTDPRATRAVKVVLNISGEPECGACV